MSNNYLYDLFINDLKKLTQNGGSMSGGGGTGGGAQSDWNAAEGEPGHVLNRTHYDGNEYILPETKAIFPADQPMAMVTFLSPPIAGETYAVNFDGTEYQCIVKEDANAPGTLCFGNMVAMGDGAEDTGEPFFGMVSAEFSAILVLDGRESATVSVFGRKVKKLTSALISMDEVVAEMIPVLDLTTLQTTPLPLNEEQRFDIDEETWSAIRSKLWSGIVRVKLNAERSFKSGDGTTKYEGEEEHTTTMFAQNLGEYEGYFHGFIYQRHLTMRCTSSYISVRNVSSGEIVAY